MHHRPLLGLLVVLLIVAGVTVLVSWLVARASARHHHTQHPHQPMAPAGAGVGMVPSAPRADDSALAALRLRYAHGEISRDDYLQASADLTGSPPAPGP